MSANSRSAISAGISVLFLLGPVRAQVPGEATSPSGGSKVRIVRLSEVKGAVQLDRNTGRGYEAAPVNVPIVEHSRLQTGTGIAEVEFEDNSTLRVAPGSIVEFTRLERLPGGATVSSVRLLSGMAYVSLLKTRGNEFYLQVGQRTLELPPSSHIRLKTDGMQASLAVFDGMVSIEAPAGPTEVARKKMVTFELQDTETEPALAKEVAPEALDTWDKDAAASHRQPGTLAAFGSPYSYGLGDMMYYGSFTNVGGCGSMWRPYFASAAWDPYANGVWAWYQGAGYSWVSPYPWGWTPYHLGSWSYCPGAGWGWQPGGSWNALNNVAAVSPSSGQGRLPARPVRPPAAGEATLTQVNLKPLVRSGSVSGDSFVFRKDSAGLGIPREGLGKLDHFSKGALDRGVTTAPIYISAPAAASGNGRPGSESIVPTSLHRGSAPTDSARTYQQPGLSTNRDGGSTRSAPSPAPQPSSQANRPVAQPSSQTSGPVAQPSNQPASPAPASSRPR